MSAARDKIRKKIESDDPHVSIEGLFELSGPHRPSALDEEDVRHSVGSQSVPFRR